MLLTATVFLSIVTVLHGSADDLYSAQFPRTYHTALERKCQTLQAHREENELLRAQYLGDSCYTLTKQKFKVPESQWRDLNSHCDKIGGFRGHMAFIWTNEQMYRMVESGFVDKTISAFIGGRRRPNETWTDGTNNPDHKNHWYYYYKNGQQAQPVDPSLFLAYQPDNEGSPPENVLAFENGESGMGYGLNDVNPTAQEMHVMCQYEPIISCPVAWTLIGDHCYRIFTNAVTYFNAKQKCEEIVNPHMSEVNLAAIHDDLTNSAIQHLASKVMKHNLAKSGPLSTNPLMFGLKFNSTDWSYETEDEADYYRWYGLAGVGDEVEFIGKWNYVALLNTKLAPDTRESKLGYWTVGSAVDKWPYICRGDPIARK